MSAREWAAVQYGILLEGGMHKEFATREAADIELLYLKFREVPAVLAVREIHTKVTETPWVEIGEAA